jgi:hypothetical protein
MQLRICDNKERHEQTLQEYFLIKVLKTKINQQTFSRILMELES